MNNFIKQVIEEKFASKAQQRFFYAKANEKGKPKKEKNKWGKWAKEFSDKSNFEEIPDKKEKEVDESILEGINPLSTVGETKTKIDKKNSRAVDFMNNKSLIKMIDYKVDNYTGEEQ